MKPVVTVLVPVFNGAGHLREAVESVGRQTFDDWELLVVDDGSTDGSAEIAEGVGDARVRVVRLERNGGLVAALNRGLAEAGGEFVARLDADDVCSRERLAEQVGFARGNPAVPLIGCDVGLISEGGRYAGRWRTAGSADLVKWELCFRTPFAHSSAFFRRRVIVEKFGGYRERRASEDLDLWSRVARDHPVVTLRRPLVKYRQREGSIMAEANAGEGLPDVRETLRENIRSAVPGLASESADVIAGAWSGRWPEDWSEYFEAVAECRRGFLRGRSGVPGLARVMADQNYTLWCRVRAAGKAAGFLTELRRRAGREFFRMPWLRMGASLVK
ncbi:MAG: glycosyltransferase [Chthoniobacterales bacterium]